MAISRNTSLFGMLAITLAATWYAAGLEDPDDLLAASEEPATTALEPGTAVLRGTVNADTATPTASAMVATQQQRMSPRGKDLFAVRSWQPPPEVPPPLPVVAPRAPPLPFRYAGRLEEDGQVVVFVSEGTSTKLLRQGDTYSNYRVEEITAQGMRLVYLPLNETQRLLFESKN